MTYLTETLPTTLVQTIKGLEQYVFTYNKLLLEIITLRTILEVHEKDYDAYLYKYSDNNSSLRVFNWSKKRMDTLQTEMKEIEMELNIKEKELYNHSWTHQVYRYDYVTYLSKGLNLPDDRKCLYN